MCSLFLLSFLMAQPRKHEERRIGFESVQLFKDQILGDGTYGVVYKAKCDDLVCAAKMLHPYFSIAQLQGLPKQEHMLPMERFEQECEFLSNIRHPNIVQYLCMYQDPETGHPVLLMELMDDSLTHFLESSPHPIAYSVQVSICHDITLALSFLHSNGIIHRDLSSNNVLLIGNIRAKLTDLGMAKLGDLKPQATRNTFITNPGTDVYMPPEADEEEPVYTEKIDCFSFGVLIVQILTQQYPKPGNRRQKIGANQQGSLEVRLAEVVRRQNHISIIERNLPGHPLLPVAIDCLNDEHVKRPSAQQLCKRVANLKKEAEYSNSIVAAQQESQQPRQLQQRVSEEKERQIEQLRQQLRQLQQSSAQEREGAKRQHGQMQQQLQQSLNYRAYITRRSAQRERQLNQQVENLMQERAGLNVRLHELEVELLRQRDHANVPQDLDIKVDKENIKLKWREGLKAPFADQRLHDAIADSNRVYFLDSNGRIRIYDLSNKDWVSHDLRTKHYCSSLIILNGLLTTVGGDLTNKLWSFTKEAGWIEKVQPMPTARYFVTAVCSGTALIVAGGVGENSKLLTTVEVLNIENHQWSTVADLPEPLQSHSATVCGDQLYILGEKCFPTELVYMCSVNSLLQTCTQKSLNVSAISLSASSSSGGAGVWSKLPDRLPVVGSTFVTYCGQLLAIGGEDSEKKSSTSVYMYNSSTISWNVISHMITARSRPFATVLPDNQLIVVGGMTKAHEECFFLDSVEFGDLC